VKKDFFEGAVETRSQPDSPGAFLAQPLSPVSSGHNDSVSSQATAPIHPIEPLE